MIAPEQQYLSEFAATAILILLGDGVVAGVALSRSKAAGAGWGVIAWAWGLAVTVGVLIAGPISGAVMNPAMTVALVLAGRLPADLAAGFIAAQMAGAFAGAVLVYLAYLAHWRDTDDPTLKLGIFCTAPAIRRPPANLLAEIIATFVLVFVTLAMGATMPAPASGPLGAGLLVVVIGMSLGGPTGYAINPARDLAPRIAHALLPIPGKGGSDWGYAWVPVLGPLIGAVLAVPAFMALY